MAKFHMGGRDPYAKPRSKVQHFSFGGGGAQKTERAHLFHAPEKEPAHGAHFGGLKLHDHETSTNHHGSSAPQAGPHGGQYHMGAGGKKVYERKK